MYYGSSNPVQVCIPMCTRTIFLVALSVCPIQGRLESVVVVLGIHGATLSNASSPRKARMHGLCYRV